LLTGWLGGCTREAPGAVDFTLMPENCHELTSSLQLGIICSCISNVMLRYSHASKHPSSEVQLMARKATSIISSFAHSPWKESWYLWGKWVSLAAA